MPDSLVYGLVNYVLNTEIRSITDYQPAALLGLPKPTKFVTLVVPDKMHFWIAEAEHIDIPFSEMIGLEQPFTIADTAFMRRQWQVARQWRFEQARISAPAVKVASTDSFLLWKQQVGPDRALTRLQGRHGGSYLIVMTVPLFSADLKRAVLESSINGSGELVVYRRKDDSWEREAVLRAWES